MHLEIDRRDIRTRRMVATSPPAAASPGQVVLAVEKFALTSNNISYALSGDMLDYWGFYPTEQGWGRLPAMGFGVVTASANADIAVGSRYFGFYPVSDHHVVQAVAKGGGFVDDAPHRANHAMAYRQFETADPGFSDDDESYYLLLRGLFVTSFLAEDFLADNDMFGAGQILITSASSKTSLALAHEYKKNARGHSVGLTSAANVDFCEATGLYDQVLTYDDIESLDSRKNSVVVDMAGNSAVLARIHRHFGDVLGHSCRIGATHWDRTGNVDSLPGPKPAFFFAPSQLAKRGKEWGRAELEKKMGSALAAFMVDARRWLTVREARGADALLDTYDALIQGRTNPADGHVLSL